MPNTARHRFVAFAALFALLLATPLAALPAPVAVEAMPAACGDCPLMAAQARMQQQARAAQDAGSGCHEEPAAPNWDCCATAPLPAVPLDEAAPTAPQTVAAPAAVVVPASLTRTVTTAVEADAPDPPSRGLFLLHSSYLN